VPRPALEVEIGRGRERLAVLAEQLLEPVEPIGSGSHEQEPQRARIRRHG
jgi:hypothetical protein